MLVLVASPGFAEIRPYLNRLLPEAEVQFADRQSLDGLAAQADILIPAMARVDEALLKGARRLRLIQQWGAGLEGVDLAAATRLGIPVANVPTAGTANADSVAEWCVMVAMVLARRLDEARANARAGSPWGQPHGMALLGRQAGIVGFGGIGRALAPRLKAMGMKVSAVTRRPEPGLEQAWGLGWLGGMQELDRLLKESDFVFLAVPAAEGTVGLINRERLRIMKPGAFLINAARGALVDEVALLQALDRGQLGGAAVDVLAQEPPAPGHPLSRHPRVVATPHIAGVTDASYADIARHVAANIRRVLSRQLPVPCANPEVRPRFL